MSTETIDLKFGFKAEAAVTGDYYKMVCSGQTIYQDSAEESCYNKETAEDFFNEILNERGGRVCNIIRIAIEKGFTFSSSLIGDIDSIFAEAEYFILGTTSTEDYKFDIVDFNWGGANGQQSIYWIDDNNNVCVDEWGQIIGEDDYNWEYKRIKEGKIEPAEWFEKEDENVYVVVGRTVDTDGNAWVLLAK